MTWIYIQHIMNMFLKVSLNIITYLKKKIVNNLYIAY